MIQTLIIDFKMPNLNDWVGAMNANRHKGAEMKKFNQQLVEAAIKQQRLAEVHKPVHIHYEWKEGNRRRDKDNVSAFGRKVINDALQTTGVLPNDNNKWVDSISETWIYDKGYGCTVTITEVTANDESV